jgi:hypothetical protein
MNTSVNPWRTLAAAGVLTPTRILRNMYNICWYPLVFVVWHYVGHCATDILCRLWCNPAPVNGSQPDLILIEHNDNGVGHQTRASTRRPQNS